VHYFAIGANEFAFGDFACICYVIVVLQQSIKNYIRMFSLMRNLTLSNPHIKCIAQNPGVELKR